MTQIKDTFYLYDFKILLTCTQNEFIHFLSFYLKT